MRRFLSIPTLTLIIALVLSTVAEYYSIVGLIAIFSGAVIPIIVMGIALGAAKLTATLWLRVYRHRASKLMQIYLLASIIALASLTSLGIFGFLSKAHIDQGVGSGEVGAKVALIDEKIKTQRENIKTSREALAQMDLQVNNVIIKGDTDKSAERSVQIRRQQAKERATIQKEIEVANAVIGKLNEERAPIASELRKVEAEVGPIKYVAAMIYGDNAEANTLEKAVRWVIILIVLVFDPLAIALLIAANQSREWDAEERKTEEDIPMQQQPVEQVPSPIAPPVIEDAEDLPLADEFWDEEPDEFDMKKHPYLNNPGPTNRNLEPPMVYRPEKEEMDPINAEQVIDTSTAPFPDYGTGYTTFKGKHIRIDALKVMHPELFIQNADRMITVSFGTDWPDKDTISTGDIAIKTDLVPNRVYKYDGNRWILIDKELSTVYLTESYIQFLIDQIGKGNYDPALLTTDEKTVIEHTLNAQSNPIH